MGEFNLRNISFSKKIFYLFTAFIGVVYFSFSAFFIYSQSKILKMHLIEEGERLSSLAAYSSRLGVFAENQDLLKGPLEGIMQNKEAVRVQVFALNEGQLKSLVNYWKEDAERPAGENTTYGGAVETVQKTRSVFHFQNRDSVEFWAPVISEGGYSEDTLFYGKNAVNEKNDIIGFVRIIFTTDVLKENLRTLLFRSILIPIFFVIPGWIIIYVIVKGITEPLYRLTEGVKAIQTGEEFESVPVETGDEIGRLAFAFNDMASSLKKREHEKAELEEQLRHSQKMEAIGTLSGGIAHDFNNILSVIKSYGQLLQKENTKEDDAHRYLDHILSSAEKASALTRSLLAIGRKQIINPRPVNLSRIIRNVESILRRVLEGDIIVSVELEDENLIVTADSGCLELVLINLANNARDAMPDGGCLNISLRTGELSGQKNPSPEPGKTERYAIISVADTGTGIDEKIRERIFDPFFTTKEVGKGTGLGLSMVYGIIRQHGGHIDVGSEPGKGSTFTIYIPLSGEAFAEHKPEELPEPEGGTETILLAEDNDDMRSLLKIVLQQHGYSVIEAADGMEAVDKFAENSDAIKLLLLDVIMPEKNGKAAYECIKEMEHGVKVLFMSGYSSDALKRGTSVPDAETLRERGPDFLSKPIAPDELLRKIREILDAR